MNAFRFASGTLSSKVSTGVTVPSGKTGKSDSGDRSGRWQFAQSLRGAFGSGRFGGAWQDLHAACMAAHNPGIFPFFFASFSSSSSGP